MELGDKIKLCREQKGMSQEELASSLGVDVPTISSYEDNSITPTPDKLASLCEVFGVTLGWLLDKGEPKAAEAPKEYASIPQQEPSPSQSGGVPYVLIKVFMIIGMAATPLSMVSSLYSVFPDSLFCLFGLLYYAVSIPLGILFLRKLRKAKSKDEIVSSGVLTLLFVNLIAGILILCMSPAQFPLEKGKDK